MNQCIASIAKAIVTYQELAAYCAEKRHAIQFKKAIIASIAIYFIAKKLYVGYFGPLSRVPGPFITRFTRIPRILLEIPRGTTYQKIQYFHERYGEIVRLAPNILSISNKNLVREVMIVKDLPKGPIYQAFQRNGEATLFSATDKKWHKDRRRVVSPAFSIKYLNSLEPFMLGCITTFIHEINKDIEISRDSDGYGSVDIWSLLQRLALDILGETSFGKSFNMLENKRHVIPDAITKSLLHNFIRAMMPFLSKIILFNAESPQPIIREFLRNIINERLTDQSKERDDILQFLIDRHKANNGSNGLTISSIIEETTLILVAGSETTSNSIGFAFYELLRSPEKLAKLYKEIDPIHVNEDGVFNHEHLKNLPYLNAVINETLRLNPVSVAGLNRVTFEPATVLGDMVLPKDINVLVNMLHLQRNEKYWPKPLEFIPERWISETELNDLEAYLPFSLGSRNCIGRNFALQEMRLTIATVLKNYDIQPIETEMEDAKIRRQFTTQRIAKNGFCIKMKCRS